MELFILTGFKNTLGVTA